MGEALRKQHHAQEPRPQDLGSRNEATYPVLHCHRPCDDDDSLPPLWCPPPQVPECEDEATSAELHSTRAHDHDGSLQPLRCPPSQTAFVIGHPYPRSQAAPL